jgi:hypothetical protein
MIANSAIKRSGATAGLHTATVPAMHFLQRYKRSTIVPVCPSDLKAFVESGDYFAL